MHAESNTVYEMKQHISTAAASSSFLEPSLREEACGEGVQMCIDNFGYSGRKWALPGHFFPFSSASSPNSRIRSCTRPIMGTSRVSGVKKWYFLKRSGRTRAEPQTSSTRRGRSIHSAWPGPKSPLHKIHNLSINETTQRPVENSCLYSSP